MTHAIAAATVAELVPVAAAALATQPRDSAVRDIRRALLRHVGCDVFQACDIAAVALVCMAERDRQDDAVKPITLDIPAPCDWISSNSRTGWRVKAKLTKQWREAAGWRAKEAGVQSMQRADIAVRVILPTARRRDPHNLIDTFKACCDGLVDVGVLPDDDSTRLTLTRIDLGEPDRTAERGVLRLLITDRSDS